MSFPKIQAILTLTNQELEEEILLAKKDLFDLRVKKGTRQTFKSHSFRHIKHKISQLLMVQKNKSSKSSSNEMKD